jgi:hypothetical protein
MPNRSRNLLLGVILLLTGLACSLPITMTIGQPTPAPAATELPTQQTAQEPTTVPPTEAATMASSETGAANKLGAVLVNPYDNKGVNLVGPDGGFLGELILGSNLNTETDNTVPSSTLAQPAENTRVIFYTFQGNSLSQYLAPGNIQQLAVTPNLVALVGDGSCDAFSYGTVDMGGNGTKNQLFLAKISQLGSNTPVVSEFDLRGFAIFPIAAICGADQPAGVWYAHMPYGIGGDIVFPPYSGLYRYDSGSASQTQYLDENQRFSGLSTDQTMAAFSPQDDLSSLIILDLKDHTQIQIATLPDSDRGAGYAVFSPDDTQVAWLEGSGFQMAETPNFHGTIRISPTKSEVQLVKNKSDAEFGAAVGLPKLWIKPVAWLDNSTLLVEGRGETWDDAYLLKLDTQSGAITLFAKGAFVGEVLSSE